MRLTHIIIPIFLFAITGCTSFSYDPPVPEPVVYTDEGLSPRLKTVIRTDHQGFHEITEARAYINKDNSISILLYPPVPAYWLGMELRIADGKFRAMPQGVSPAPGQVAFEVTKQELILQNAEPVPGNIISGCASVNFIQHEKDGPSAPHFFTGCFSAAFYPEGGYTPLSPQSLSFIAEQDFDMAQHELGAPMHKDIFMMNKAEQFRSEVLGQLVSLRTEVLEATWDTSMESQLGSMGTQRMTVWYTRQGDQWFPVGHSLWTRGLDRVPDYMDKQ